MAWVQIAAATLSVNSLRQTVHTHRASVHQAAKLVAALLRVARVTAGLAESNGSLPPGLWLTSPAGWLPRTGISYGTLLSAIEYGLPLPFFLISEEADVREGECPAGKCPRLRAGGHGDKVTTSHPSVRRVAAPSGSSAQFVRYYHRLRQSCPVVRLTHGLGWVGSTIAKVLKVWNDYVNALEARVKFCV